MPRFLRSSPLLTTSQHPAKGEAFPCRAPWIQGDGPAHRLIALFSAVNRPGRDVNLSEALPLLRENVPGGAGRTSQGHRQGPTSLPTLPSQVIPSSRPAFTATVLFFRRRPLKWSGLHRTRPRSKRICPQAQLGEAFEFDRTPTTPMGTFAVHLRGGFTFCHATFRLRLLPSTTSGTGPHPLRYVCRHRPRSREQIGVRLLSEAGRTNPHADAQRRHTFLAAQARFSF